MIEYMNIPVLVCVSLLGVGAFVMIVGSLLKKQWATEGKKTSLSIYLLYLFAMSGSGWTWYDSIHKARALAEGNRYTLATYEKVSCDLSPFSKKIRRKNIFGRLIGNHKSLGSIWIQRCYRTRAKIPDIMLLQFVRFRFKNNHSVTVCID